MNLTKTSEYALRILLYLSLHPDRLVTTRELCRELHLSFKYIGRLLSQLVEAGLVHSERGKQGGYRLNQDASRISLFEVVQAVDDWNKYTQCMMGFGHCNEENPCAFHDLWKPIREELIQLFTKTTVEELKQHKDKKI